MRKFIAAAAVATLGVACGGGEAGPEFSDRVEDVLVHPELQRIAETDVDRVVAHEIGEHVVNVYTQGEGAGSVTEFNYTKALQQVIDIVEADDNTASVPVYKKKEIVGTDQISLEPLFETPLRTRLSPAGEISTVLSDQVDFAFTDTTSSHRVSVITSNLPISEPMYVEACQVLTDVDLEGLEGDHDMAGQEIYCNAVGAALGAVKDGKDYNAYFEDVFSKLWIGVADGTDYFYTIPVVDDVTYADLQAGRTPTRISYHFGFIYDTSN